MTSCCGCSRRSRRDGRRAGARSPRCWRGSRSSRRRLWARRSPNGRCAMAAAPLASSASTVGTTTGRPAITTAEQRLVSLVLSGPVASGELPEPDRLVQTATAYGGRLEPLAEGANLVLFADAHVAQDHAV